MTGLLDTPDHFVCAGQVVRRRCFAMPPILRHGRRTSWPLPSPLATAPTTGRDARVLMMHVSWEPRHAPSEDMHRRGTTPPRMIVTAAAAAAAAAAFPAHTRLCRQHSAGLVSDVPWLPGHCPRR